MENISDFLTSIGFNKNEAEVYGALLKLGTSSVLEIAKITKMHRSSIYDSLRLLTEKGLVYTVENPTKKFTARDPKNLIDHLKRREIELQEILKNYEIYHSKKESPSVQLSQGTMALRQAIENSLIPKQTINVFGIPVQALELIGPMIQDFHKKRIQEKISMRHIYNASGIERARYLNKMKYTEARILPPKYDARATTNIVGDVVTIFTWGKEVTVVEMKEPEIAKTYANYFEILWSKAKTIF